MKPSVLVASVPVAVLVLATVFSPSSAPAQFTPLSGGGNGAGGGGSSGLQTALDVKTVVLGDDFSFKTLTVTNNDPSKPSIQMLGGKFWGDSPTVSAGAYFQYSYSGGGWLFGHPINNCPGCVLWTDILRSRQLDRPVAVDEPKGFKITCKSTLDTCGSGTIAEGTQQTLCATATSRTRICTCTASSNSSPTYAWALSGGAGAVGTNTTCPEVSP